MLNLMLHKMTIRIKSQKHYDSFTVNLKKYFQSRIMRTAGDRARMGWGDRNICRILVGKPEQKKTTVV